MSGGSVILGRIFVCVDVILMILTTTKGTKLQESFCGGIQGVRSVYFCDWFLSLSVSRSLRSARIEFRSTYVELLVGFL